MTESFDVEGRVKREFALRKRRQIMVAIGVVPVIGLLLLSKGKWGPAVAITREAGPYLFGAILLAVGYSFWNWRCPACRKYLGKSLGPAFCAGCGAKLR
jgi:hypothetical protein